MSRNGTSLVSPDDIGFRPDAVGSPVRSPHLLEGDGASVAASTPSQAPPQHMLATLPEVAQVAAALDAVSAARHRLGLSRDSPLEAQEEFVAAVAALCAASCTLARMAQVRDVVGDLDLEAIPSVATATGAGDPPVSSRAGGGAAAVGTPKKVGPSSSGSQAQLVSPSKQRMSNSTNTAAKAVAFAVLTSEPQVNVTGIMVKIGEARRVIQQVKEKVGCHTVMVRNVAPWFHGLLVPVSDSGSLQGEAACRCSCGNRSFSVDCRRHLRELGLVQLSPSVSLSNGS